MAVARHGGFSAAAKATFRSQSRISEHVAELEKSLGLQLFDRTAHPAVLTAEGRALLPDAEEILNRLGSLADRSGNVRGHVRFGAYPSVAAWLFPRVAVRLRREHPDLRLLLHEGPSLELEGALSRGELDLAIRPVHPLVTDDALVHELLWKEPLIAVFPAGSAPVSVGLAELAELPLISIGEASGSRQFESHLAFASAGLNPPSIFRTNQPQTLLSLVRHGLGIGVTNALAMLTANLDGVRLVPIRDAGVERQVAVFRHRARPESAALDQVLEEVRAVSSTPPAWPSASG
ncbi:LysR family transcriptional regulator [Kribbella sancticallisti]|uniref:LysR family transcriptional regulator n=1 Tax=Kribbella sancticallisti TaxID=460087 RepID=A0ABP4MXR0_9ACTN